MIYHLRISSNPTLPHLQPQTLPHILPDNLLILRSLLPPHPRTIYIRRTLIIRLRQHTHHTDENLLHGLNRRPPFRRLFVLHRVFAGRVQNRDADFAVGIYYFPQLVSQSI
jgi:hypothetical protein